MKWTWVAGAAGAFTIVALWRWLWPLEPAFPAGPSLGGVRLPVGASGSASVAWWGTVVLVVTAVMVLASLLFACCFHLRHVAAVWPRAACDCRTSGVACLSPCVCRKRRSADRRRACHRA
ncbi:MAG: hypothetical protein IPK20_18620 [Betaproteobacteria bacterium]|nr:hypothetical protein [Betaproteobacteria bacterium]